ncbi:M91 family zinc metallopeptidase [Trinickia caryophylli]|uniref:Effector protein n=2 Tax=Trinickia caryophylli TaxID=28094 RepID=A0A1X7CLN9_TRICW|nr:M91 family zinc metallopeptidase [Trinickia caryophylli]TRX20046.1 T3SS effector protein NleD [Trinickia caryophylli]SME99068.1 Effector protein [Trinickia caryophylli]
MFRPRLQKAQGDRQSMQADAPQVLSDRGDHEQATHLDAVRLMPPLTYGSGSTVGPEAVPETTDPPGDRRPDLGLNLGLRLMFKRKETRIDLKDARRRSRVKWLRESRNVFIEGSDAAAFEQFEAALGIVESAPVGRTLLDCIDATATLKRQRVDVFLDGHLLGVIPHVQKDADNGKGTGSELHCNFSVAQSPGVSSADRLKSDAAVLFHELVHVFHNLLGERIRVAPNDAQNPLWPALLHEEARTVGLGSFSQEALSENAFRHQIGLARRPHYSHDAAIIYDDDTAVVRMQRRRLLP